MDKKNFSLPVKWFYFQGLMKVGDSFSATLLKLLSKKVLPALKPVTAEETETLEEIGHTIIQNAVEVCFVCNWYNFC